MTPGIVDTGQHSEEQSQQDKDDKDHNHHPRVATEPGFLVLMIYFQPVVCQPFLRVVFSVRAEHLYRSGVNSKDWGWTSILEKIGHRLCHYYNSLVDCNNILWKIYGIVDWRLFPLSEMFSCKIDVFLSFLPRSEEEGEIEYKILD